MTRARSRSAAILATLTIVVLTAPVGRQASLPGPYVLTDLGTLGGLSAQAYDLNDHGRVVGYATNASSQGRAFVWAGGQMTDLGTLGGLHADAQAINNLGQVVGRSRLNTSSVVHAVLWNNGTTIDLTPNTAESSVANAINNLGQVVGTRNNTIAFMWDRGVMTDLPHLGGGGAYGWDINDAGQAVGSSNTAIVTQLGPMPHAVLWQNGTATDLGVVPGQQDSGASAINSLGQIVGSSGTMDPDTYEITSRAFLYENGEMKPLPVPSWEAYAADINDGGVVVGTMRAAGGLSKFHAYVYADGVATNLNTLVQNGSGLHLAYAYAINNAGQIAAVALDGQARYHAVLLTPEPAGTPLVPRVKVNHVDRTEGQSGLTQFSFTVSLSAASSSAATVAFATANGSARATEDYDARSGLLSFAPGETVKTITVSVRGDRKREYDEVFYLNLSSPNGASIENGQGTGTGMIRNDDR
jgi:probable HAF family extracellular repeat protein